MKGWEEVDERAVGVRLDGLGRAGRNLQQIFTALARSKCRILRQQKEVTWNARRHRQREEVKRVEGRQGGGKCERNRLRPTLGSLFAPQRTQLEPGASCWRLLQSGLVTSALSRVCGRARFPERHFLCHVTGSDPTISRTRDRRGILSLTKQIQRRRVKRVSFGIKVRYADASS